MKDVLFPYARNNVATYMNENKDKKEVINIVNDFRELVATEAFNNELIPVPGIKNVDVHPSKEEIDAVVQNVYKLMDNDSKVGVLKNLQGLIWEGVFLYFYNCFFLFL